MKKSFFLFSGALLFYATLCGRSAWAQVGADQASTMDTRALYTSIDLYGRARYFHAVVKQRRCDLLDAGAVSAIDQRFENVRARLVARYGEKFFKIDQQVNVPSQALACDRMTLNAYSNHVAEVEQILQEGKP